MTKYPLLGLLLVSTLSADAAQAAPCLETKVVVFYINGIRTGPEDAEHARRTLKRKLSTDLGCDVPVLLSYNTFVSAGQDLEESFGQWLEEHSLPSIGSELFWLAAGGVSDYREQNYVRAVARLTQFFADEIARNVEALAGNPTDEQEIDIQAHLAQYRVALESGYRVLIVGHSQGNLFANIEYGRMLASDADAASRMAVIAVATPAARVAGREDYKNWYTTLHGDFIHHLGDALPSNVSGPGCESSTVVGTIAGSMNCHSIWTYLLDQEPWERISNQLRLEIVSRVPTVTSVVPISPRSSLFDQFIDVSGSDFQCSSIPSADQCLKVEVRVGGALVGTLQAPEQIQNVTPSRFGMLVTLGTPGPYSVEVVNPDGGRSAPFSINVLPGVAEVTAFIDPDAPNADPAVTETFGQATFGTPHVHADGSLRILSFHPQGAKLNRFDVDTIPTWRAPLAPSEYISTSLTMSEPVTIGAVGRTYVHQGGTAFGFDWNGELLPGWPITPGVDMGNVRLASHRPLIVDPVTNTAVLKVGVWFSFTGFPDALFGVSEYGTETWPRFALGNGGPLVGLVQGPNRTAFTITDNATGGTNFTLIGVDPDSGMEVCRSPTTSYSDGFTGGREAVFTSFEQTIRIYDGNCQATAAFQTDRNAIVAKTYIGEVVLGVDYFTSVPNSTRLLGVFRDGTFLWRNDRIEQPLVQDLAEPWILQDGRAYVLGKDREDALRSKLFVVQVVTGDVIAAIPLDTVCPSLSCGVGVAPDRTIYLTSRDAAQPNVIWRIGLP